MNAPGNGPEPELPEGWEWKQLGQIADCRLGKMLDKEKNVGELRPYLRNINVQWGTFHLDDIKEMRITESEIERYEVRSGDLVVCEGGEPGRCAVWRDDRTMFFQKALHRVRPDETVSVDYLHHYLRLAAFSGRLEPLLTGTTIKHLPGINLARVHVAVPPLDTQHRIVERLSHLLLEILEGEKLLARATLLHGTFRSRWLSQTLRLGGRSTPERWSSKKLAEVADLSSGGTPSRARPEYFGAGHPWVKIGDLTEGEVVSTEEAITAAGLRESSAELRPAGTVLLAMYGASIGRTGVLGVEASTNQAICAMRPRPSEITAGYLLLVLQASRTTFVAAGYGGAQPNISQRYLKGFELPVPPLEEQERIVRQVAERAIAIGALEAVLIQSKVQANRLRRSVLNHAVTGAWGREANAASRLTSVSH